MKILRKTDLVDVNFMT